LVGLSRVAIQKGEWLEKIKEWVVTILVLLAIGWAVAAVRGCAGLDDCPDYGGAIDVSC